MPLPNALRALTLALLGLLPAVGTLAATDPPAVADQVAQGATLYTRHCAVCHGAKLEGGLAPALRGSAFATQWQSGTRTSGDLYYVMKTSMPRPAVGSLSRDQYLAILAHVLKENGLGPRDAPLTEERLGARLAAGPATATAAPRETFIQGSPDHPIGHGPYDLALAAAAASTDWPSHNHDDGGTRYSPLTQITRHNANRLKVACLYQVGALENFVTGPVVDQGTMYLTTPQLTIAIDAANCHERWRYRWTARDTELWPNNRGVAISAGYVVRGTNDGYLIALDAADGRLIWARQVARPAAGETFTMPPLIVEDRIIIGPAGSENSIQGWVGAFSLRDGAPLWRFNTVPAAGEPGFETWIHDPTMPIGGGAVWSPLSVDRARGEVYVPVTNPAPVFGAYLRRGANLYTDALIALDLKTGALRWYAQMVPNDDKDWDVTQVSPLIDVQIDGRMRPLVIAGGKDGIVRAYDRDTHQLLHETPLGTRLNVDVPVTKEGTRFCPGDLGGLQWNGPAWAPKFGLLVVPSVDWCTTGKLADPTTIVSGKDYFGGTDTMDPEGTGLLTAIDAATGRIRWQYHSPKPMVAGVTTTAGDVVFTAENTGDFDVFDVENGHLLYRFNVGGAMTAGVITYAVESTQYVAVASGRGSFWFGEQRGAPMIAVFTLDAAKH